MKLFKYENYKLIIAPEAYALKCFKKLVDRDRTKEKINAMKELAYIYFVYDPRSDFQYEVEETARQIKVKEQIGLDLKWKPDTLVLDAIETYKLLTITTSSLLLQDTRAMIENLRKELPTLSIKERDDKGKLVYNIAQIMSAAKQVPALAKEIAEAERSVLKEIEDLTEMRGAKQKSILDDGFNQFIQ